LAWSVPLYDATYWSPSAAIHSFLMFSPFFVIKTNMMFQGVILWATGPYLASWITDNLQEQASIWCFFSIMQIGIMLFVIRDHLLRGWGMHAESARSSGGTANGSDSKSTAGKVALVATKPTVSTKKTK